METPKSYVQVLMVDGAVHDLSEGQWQLLKPEIEKHEWKFIPCEDIYGSECLVRGHYVTSVRFWTKEAGENYKSCHADDEVDGESHE